MATTSRASDSIIDELSIQADGFFYFSMENRLETFRGKWRYDLERGATCSSQKMAKAGFVCTVEHLSNSDPSASCFVCKHEMIFDSTDEPIDEHRSHVPECPFVRIGKEETEYTVRDYIRLLSFIYAMKKDSDAEEMIENLKLMQQRTIARFRSLIDSEK